MKKAIRKLGALAAAGIVAISSYVPVSAEEGYTYNYDYWEDVQYSPDAYRVAGVFGWKEMGLNLDLEKPGGLYVYGDSIYLCDSGNNRILELERPNRDTIRIKREIKGFKGKYSGDKNFSGPSDVAISEDGHFFISDKNNGRILKLDNNLNFVMEFLKPQDSTFDQGQDFLPDKIAVDTAGRVYCVASNVNKGLIKFEADGTFSGYVGATKVVFDWTDYVWKKLATKEQRAQMESFVPTEYSNLNMDSDGFIYVCTENVAAGDLRSGSADSVRRLNLMGNDILIRNGNFKVIGDLYWEEGGGYEGTSKFVDVTALENDIYTCLDKNRGRLFTYDSQGRLLYAFGGNGNMDGYFRRPVALEHMGRDLLVLDELDKSITVFTPTEFGTLIYQAIDQFQQGEYEKSGETWQKVLNLNGNYDLAYIGIGRSLLRQDKYKEAMEYFKLKLDIHNYSNAFKQYRKQWVEEHIGWIILVLFLVLCVPLMIGRLKKIKFEIDYADIFRR